MSDTESRWMTYRELSTELGISPRAAEARARRQVQAGRWRHRNDNDAFKTARVLVPISDLENMRGDTAGDTKPDTAGDTVPDAVGSTDPHGFKPLVDALEAAHARELAVRDEWMAELRKRLETAEAMRDEARAIRDEALAELARTRDEPGLAKALRQGRATLASWISGRKP